MTNLYSIVKEQFPEFTKSDYPAFLEFVQAYYKWLEIQSAGSIDKLTKIDSTDTVVFIETTYEDSAVDISQFVGQIIYGESNEARAIVKRVTGTAGDEYYSLYISYITKDDVFTNSEIISVLVDGIDGSNPIKARLLSSNSSVSVPSLFVEYFRRQLDTLGLFNNIVPVNIRYLTNIKEIYAAKGSEQALTFLLETIYGSEAVIRYPSENLLKPSDGRWRQLKHIDVEVIYGSPNLNDKLIYIIDNDARIPLNIEYSVALPDITELARVRLYYYDTYALLVGQLIQYIDNDISVCVSRVINTVNSVDIIDGGSGWQLGQLIKFPGSARDTYARVSKIDTSGAIINIEFAEYGFDHTNNQTIDVYPNISNLEEEKATLTLKTGTIAKQIGRWGGNYGLVSNQETRLQDSKYYQQFSYDVETKSNPAQYLQSLFGIHPAGSKLYTTQILAESIQFSPNITSSYPYRHISYLDIINVSDSDISFTLTKELQDTLVITDTIAFNLINNSIVLDSISVVDGSTATVSTSVYDSEIYFSEDYVYTEKQLDLT